MLNIIYGDALLKVNIQQLSSRICEQFYKNNECQFLNMTLVMLFAANHVVFLSEVVTLHVEHE